MALADHRAVTGDQSAACSERFASAHVCSELMEGQQHMRGWALAVDLTSRQDRHVSPWIAQDWGHGPALDSDT